MTTYESKLEVFGAATLGFAGRKSNNTVYEFIKQPHSIRINVAKDETYPLIEEVYK